MILTAGCSWTEQYHDLFPMWPSLLSNEVTNIGVSGLNNLKIAHRILSYKNISEIDKVLVLWTHWLREYCFIEQQLHTAEWKVIENRYEQVPPGQLSNIDSAKYFAKDKFTKEILRDNIATNMLAIHTVQEYLHRNNVDYYMVQGLCPYYDIDYLDLYLKEISTLEHLIDQDKFYRFPPIYEVGGFNCEDNLKLTTDKNLILQFDNHPNEKGHKLIADVFMSNTEMIRCNDG